jgi:beta-galactosidase
MAIPDVRLTEGVSLLGSLDVLSHPVRSATPLPMEMLEQNHGFVLYETQISGLRQRSPLDIRELHDRVHVFLDGELIGIVEREFPEKTLSFAIPNGGATLTILVENMGRINYGHKLLDRKGITECVTLGQQILHGWTIRSLPLDDLFGLPFGPRTQLALPGFFRGTFEVDEPRDSFLYPAGWTKGVAWLNGFNLGRYWSRGPQQTLYVPGPLFRRGENSLILLELDGAGGNVEFLREPILDTAQPHVGTFP